MRILLAALHPPGGSLPYGGVQSWISTVARRLFLDGHDVEVWGPEFPLPRQRFELGIFAHRSQTKYAAPLCETAGFVSHGIVDAEQPGQGLTFYTAEEIRAYWRASGPILRQPIDMAFWSPIAKPFQQNAVFYSYRARSCFGLDQISDALGYKFLWMNDVAPEKARDVLQNAAVVFASGRAALEAMACGAPTIICDWRDYNGLPLVCACMEKARAYNYSGRGGQNPQDVDMVHLARETIAFQKPRAYVAEHHDAKAIVDELMQECLPS